MVKIHVAAPALAALNSAALRQTDSIVSCATSSACALARAGALQIGFHPRREIGEHLGEGLAILPRGDRADQRLPALGARASRLVIGHGGHAGERARAAARPKRGRRERESPAGLAKRTSHSKRRGRRFGSRPSDPDPRFAAVSIRAHEGNVARPTDQRNTHDLTRSPQSRRCRDRHFRASPPHGCSIPITRSSSTKRRSGSAVIPIRSRRRSPAGPCPSIPALSSIILTLIPILSSCCESSRSKAKSPTCRLPCRSTTRGSNIPARACVGCSASHRTCCGRASGGCWPTSPASTARRRWTRGASATTASRSAIISPMATTATPSAITTFCRWRARSGRPRRPKSLPIRPPPSCAFRIITACCNCASGRPGAP